MPHRGMITSLRVFGNAYWKRKLAEDIEARAVPMEQPKDFLPLALFPPGQKKRGRNGMHVKRLAGTGLEKMKALGF